MRKLSILVLLAAAAIASPAARADVPTYDTFVVTSITDPNFSTLTFTLPHSPTPDSSNLLLGEFTVGGTATVTAPSGTSTTADAFQFYDLLSGGGVSDSLFLAPYGPQLFYGTLDAPTFIEGTFNLSNTVVGAVLGPTDYVLTISSTPEPSSLMLLGTGALGMAGVARRRFSR